MDWYSASRGEVRELKVSGPSAPGLLTSGLLALGIIETRGRSPLIEAVDAAIKAAPVNILASYFVGGGCNAVTLTGDTGAVEAALAAARKLMGQPGMEGCTHLIPRPAGQVWTMIAEKQYGIE